MTSCCKYILSILVARPWTRVLSETNGDEVLVDRLILETSPDKNERAHIRTLALALLVYLRKKYGGT